jgi:hypothetical protein
VRETNATTGKWDPLTAPPRDVKERVGLLAGSVRVLASRVDDSDTRDLVSETLYAKGGVLHAQSLEEAIAASLEAMTVWGRTINRIGDVLRTLPAE